MDRPPRSVSLAVHRFDGDRQVHLGPDGVVEVVREGGEGDVGDHLYYLLVGVARLPDLFDRAVRDVPAVLGNVAYEG